MEAKLAAVDMCLHLSELLREAGLRSVFVVVEGDDTTIDGQPVYISDLPREVGVALLRGVVDSVGTGEIESVLPDAKVH